MIPRAIFPALAALPMLGAGCNGALLHGGSVLNAQLPIRRVVLYQNGVGYFEREGRLRGNVLTLHCRPSQINDLLKSLTVIDRGSGRPLSVSLPLEKSGDKVLAELPKQVRGAAGLLDVLRVFRGAHVRVHGEASAIEGRVLGVEQGLQRARENAPAPWSVTLKDRKGDLLVYPVHKIKRVELLDRTLEAGLDKSLDVSLEEGSWKSIALSVRLAGGDGDHDLLVSYIVEMPMWKPAYRLVLHRERPPLLQGWAVVDNVSGEAWRDARLSLVTGTPMSFLYDLHAPRFARRPDLTPRGVAVAEAPPEEKPADETSVKDKLQREYAPRRGASGEARPEVDAPSPPKPSAHRRGPGGAKHYHPSEMNVFLERQLEKTKEEVKGQRVGGSLFRYDLKDPVTIPDSSSTLVNIVNARVPGEQVVLFRPELTSASAASHPYRAVKFRNDSGFALEAGPVALYAEGTFVGEGFLERMEQRQTLFLTYSIDGSVRMTQTHAHGEEAVRLLKIHRGMIESEVLNTSRATYTIASSHDTQLTAFVKSARPSREHRLRNAPKGTVETAEASYVPVTIAGKGKRELTVEWVSPVRRWLAVDTSLATTVLRLFLGKGEVPAGTRPALEKILAAREKLDRVEAEIARVSNLRSELHDDQSRVRSNLEALRKVRGNEALKAKLARNLSSLEDQLSKLTARYVKLDEEKAALQAEMRSQIAQISLDAKGK
jgi:hypothetical protein